MTLRVWDTTAAASLAMMDSPSPRPISSGLPLRFYQVVAPDPGGYFIFQGLVGSDIAAEYLPEFQRLTASFRRRQPTVTSDRGTAATH